MNKILSALLLVAVICVIGQGRVINELRKDVDTANTRANESSAEAFGDCQRIMAMNEFMVRINTCLQVVEVMCSGQSKCMAEYQPMCHSEDYE